MGSPKEPQREPQNSGATPWRQNRKAIVCKSEPRSEQIEDRQQEAAQTDKRKQYPFSCIRSVDGLLDAASASFKDPTNTDVGNEANEENEVPRLDSHGCVTISNSSWPNCHSFTESRLGS